MVSGSYTCHSHQHGALRQQNLRTSPRHQSETKPAYVHMELRLHFGMDHRHLYGLKWYGGPRCPFEKANPESESFLISGFHFCPETGESQGWTAGSCLIQSQHKLSLLCTIPLTLLGKGSRSSQPFLSAVTAIMSPVSPLSIAHTSLFFSFSPLQHILVLCSSAQSKPGWCLVWLSSPTASSPYKAWTVLGLALNFIS